MTRRPKLLHVTDLYYPSQGRIYYEEDLYLSQQLGQHFDLVLCHPKTAAAYVADVDLVLFRNTGPVMYFAAEYAAFRQTAQACKAKVFNQLTGKADMLGKQYLIDLFQAEYPVIPSVDCAQNLSQLPTADRYITKLKQGADSIGVEFVAPTALYEIDFTGRFVQPVVDFVYEVSFYFINHDFQYALYAPNPKARWKLVPYAASAEDLAYAQRFIVWNDIDYGIQRIDACRMPDGSLLLMEVEDINPYLSLDLLPAAERDAFVQHLIHALLSFETL